MQIMNILWKGTSAPVLFGIPELTYVFLLIDLIQNKRGFQKYF